MSLGEQLRDLARSAGSHSCSVYLSKNSPDAYLEFSKPSKVWPRLDGERFEARSAWYSHRVEVDVGEVDALFGAVVDPLAGQVAVQVHLAEADRVAAVVALLDRAAPT